MKNALPLSLLLAACGSSPQYSLTREQLLDPQSCKSCHEEHYQDWSGSMHAYAAEDPVFVAMNKRGQRETQGALGTFCVNCHAPLAVREGLTQDGLNLDAVPASLKGVTCFACHAVDAVEGTHDNPLRLAADGVMRGGIRDPQANGAHASGYSPFHDRDRTESAAMCGSCHDIVTGHGAAIERTFAEWQASVFSKSPGGTTCGQCHMPQSAQARPVSNLADSPARRPHSHAWPAVDLALTPFPNLETQRQGVQDSLDSTLQSAVCVEQGNRRIRVVLDNVGAGHSFPSGAAQDRRLWVEVVGYSGSNVVYQSGVVAPGADLTKLADPDLWLLRDCMFGTDGAKVEMFWEAASTEGNMLSAPVTLDSSDPRYYQTHVVQTYPKSGVLPAGVDRVTVRILLQPVGTDVLQELVRTGDLDAKHVEAMPTLVVGKGPALEWTPAATTGYVDKGSGLLNTCVTQTNLDVRAEKFPAKRSCRP